MKKRWLQSQPITPEADQQLFSYPPLFRQVLFNRKIFTQSEAVEFLKANGPEFSPSQLKGMDQAVARIFCAIDNHESIVVYGDYDADGVTATAVLIETLDVLGNKAEFYIPNRFDEGYGLNLDAVESLAARGSDLIITVDCGIRSPKEVDFAQEHGVDVIITDHHYPLGELPAAVAVVCPKQAGDEYPNKDLSGVGLAYKLAHALLSVRKSDAGDPSSLLDLVAVGTIADMVPLTGENRILVRKGLQAIRTGKRVGLARLAEVSGLKIQHISSGNIGFALAPRLNAAGRLNDDEEATQKLFYHCRTASDEPSDLGLGILSVQLLIEKNFEISQKLAARLHLLNAKRQDLTRTTVEKADEILKTAMTVKEEDGNESMKIPKLIYARDESFNEGVIGLVASRLKDEYYRPTMVLADHGDTLKASCRSIPEFHITQALDECAHLMIRHGGHAAAAGLTVAKQHVNELIFQMQKIAERELNGYLELTPGLIIDAIIPTKQFSDLNPELVSYLELLEPTGIGNPRPIFVINDVAIKNPVEFGKQNRTPDQSEIKKTKEDVHVRFLVDSSQKAAIPPCVWFRANAEAVQASHGKIVNIAFTFEKNRFNQSEYYQLIIRDIEFKK